MESNFVPENLPTFLDLRMRLTDTIGRLNAARLTALFSTGIYDAEADQMVYNLANLAGHQGGLLLRLESSWAGLNLTDAPDVSHYPQREVVLTRAA